MAEGTDLCTHSLDYLSEGGVYHLAGRPHTTHTSQLHSDSLYAEVPTEALVGRFPHDNTYELIPGRGDSADTYEPLEDIKPKHHQSFWGLKVSNDVTMHSHLYLILQKLYLMFALFI